MSSIQPDITPAKIEAMFNQLRTQISKLEAEISNLAVSISGSPLHAPRIGGVEKMKGLLPSISSNQVDLSMRLENVQAMTEKLHRYVAGLPEETAMDRAATEALAKTLAPRSSQSVGASEGGARVA